MKTTKISNRLSSFASRKSAECAVSLLSHAAESVEIIPNDDGSFDVRFLLPSGAPIWRC